MNITDEHILEPLFRPVFEDADCVLTCPSSPEEKQGFDEENNAPSARSGHRTVYYNGNMYSIGGYSDHGDRTDDDQDKRSYPSLWKFSLFRRHWVQLVCRSDSNQQTLTAPTDQLISHCCTLIPPSMKCRDGRLFVFGGTTKQFGHSNSQTVWIVNLRTLVWTAQPRVENTPSPRYGPGVCYDGRRQLVYIFGGTAGQISFNDLYSYDFSTNTWTCLFQPEDYSEDYHYIPQPRYRCELAIYKNKLYVIGGSDTQHPGDMRFCSLCFIFYYDLQLNHWFSVETNLDDDVLLPRDCHGLCQAGRYVYVTGGRTHERPRRDVLRLDLETMQWHVYSFRLPKPLFFHGTCLTEDGELLTFGGVTTRDRQERTNQIFRFAVDVSSLRTLAWNCYLSDMINNRKLNPFSEKERKRLRQLGIPADFLQQTLDLTVPVKHNSTAIPESALPIKLAIGSDHLERTHSVEGPW